MASPLRPFIIRWARGKHAPETAYVILQTATPAAGPTDTFHSPVDTGGVEKGAAPGALFLESREDGGCISPDPNESPRVQRIGGGGIPDTANIDSYYSQYAKNGNIERAVDEHDAPAQEDVFGHRALFFLRCDNPPLANAPSPKYRIAKRPVGDSGNAWGCVRRAISHIAEETCPKERARAPTPPRFYGRAGYSGGTRFPNPPYLQKAHEVAFRCLS